MNQIWLHTDKQTKRPFVSPYKQKSLSSHKDDRLAYADHLTVFSFELCERKK